MKRFQLKYCQGKLTGILRGQEFYCTESFDTQTEAARRQEHLLKQTGDFAYSRFEIVDRASNPAYTRVTNVDGFKFESD